MNTILIATDGSDAARKAVEFGLELAAAQHAPPVFAHVAPAVDVLATGGFGLAASQPHKLTEYDRGPRRKRRRSRPNGASMRRRRCSAATPSTSSSPTRTRSTPT